MRAYLRTVAQPCDAKQEILDDVEKAIHGIVEISPPGKPEPEISTTAEDCTSDGSSSLSTSDEDSDDESKEEPKVPEVKSKAKATVRRTAAKSRAAKTSKEEKAKA